jgi:hypothetical protein
MYDALGLATSTVSVFLVPYLKLGAEKFVEAVGKAAGEQGVNAAQQLWTRVRKAFSKDEEEQAVISQFEKHPEAAGPLVITLLKEKLEQDKALVQDLTELIRQFEQSQGMSGAQIGQATIAGIADLRQANFAGAKHVRIVGTQVKQRGDNDLQTSPEDEESD